MQLTVIFMLLYFLTVLCSLDVAFKDFFFLVIWPSWGNFAQLSEGDIVWYAVHIRHEKFAMAVGNFLMPSDKCTSHSRGLGLCLPTKYEKRAGGVRFRYVFEYWFFFFSQPFCVNPWVIIVDCFKIIVLFQIQTCQHLYWWAQFINEWQKL